MAILNGNMMINRGNRTNDLTLNMWILMWSSWDLSRHAVGYRKDMKRLYKPTISYLCVCVCVLNIGYCRSPSGNFNEEHDNDKPWVHWAKVGCHSGVSKGIVSDSGGMVREENQLVDGQFPRVSQLSLHTYPTINTYHPFRYGHQQPRVTWHATVDFRLISDISGRLKPLINHCTCVGTGSIDCFFHIALQQVWPLGRWHM